MDNQLELLAALQADIAARLRPVCEGMPAEKFDELVRDIAAVKLKYGLDAETEASLRERLNALLSEGEEDGGSAPHENGLQS